MRGRPPGNALGRRGAISSQAEFVRSLAYGLFGIHSQSAGTDPETSQTASYLERILQSEGFRKAPNLRNLLEYLVARSNEGHADQLKRSAIAIEVFGRRTDFDGRLDNIVRVQAHRLRKLLEIYYSEEGKNDKLRLAVPHGGYIPQISMLEDPGPEIGPAQVSTMPAIPQPGSDATLTAPAPSFPWARAAIFTGVFFAGSLLMFVVMQLNSGERQPRVDPAVSQIWRGIFEPGIKLIVSYTNPVFLRVGRSRTYLLYQGPLSEPAGTQIDIADTDPAIDKQYVASGQPLFFSDGWTGTGEVLGVNRLTEIGTQFKQSIDVIPSRALSLDEVRSSNVIFLGSPGSTGYLPRSGTIRHRSTTQTMAVSLFATPEQARRPSMKTAKIPGPVKSNRAMRYSAFFPVSTLPARLSVQQALVLGRHGELSIF